VVKHGKSSLTVKPRARGRSVRSGPDDLFAVMSDPTRRSILERLRESPKPVVELARGLPVSRPAVSQHLKVLKESHLVTDRQVANRRIYSLDAEGLAPLMAYLDGFWRLALDSFARKAAEVYGKRRS